MKNTIHKIGKNILLLFTLAVLITACEKSDDLILETPRLFKPSDIKVVAGETSATLTWAAPLFSTGKALTYTVAFSKDANFATIAYAKDVTGNSMTVTEDVLAVRTPYYVRVVANSFEGQPESKPYYSSGTFTLTGIQLFLAVRESEIRETSVTLRYKTTDPTLTSIKLTPATGSVVTATLSSGDVTAGLKLVTGLVGGKQYTAELFSGTKSKGITTVTTLPVTTYTTTISTTDDLAATIAAAANGAVIGLNPGTYDIKAAATIILEKTITLKSTSGDPNDTKINFKEFTIKGTGAGLTLSGLELDGTPGAAAYFINFVGTASDAAAATFTNVVVDNCIAHGATTAFLRANRGTAAKDHKITGITVNNSLVYDMGSAGQAYYTFHLDKLQFTTLTVSKSTFYNCGYAGIVTAATLLSGVTAPVINITNSTFNGFGGNAKYAVLDANTNPVSFTMQNCILANTPRGATTVQAAALRSTGTGYSTTFNNNNTFGLLTATTAGTALTLPTGSANQTIDLGWLATTTTFTLPSSSALRTASTTGGAIGDPRWTY
ncbi:MAG: SusE domain-containing protein [Sphingobacteriaceae bacterium]